MMSVLNLKSLHGSFTAAVSVTGGLEIALLLNLVTFYIHDSKVLEIFVHIHDLLFDNSDKADKIKTVHTKTGPVSLIGS